MTAGFAISLLVQFGTNTHGYQFVENHRWMGELGVRYLLGVDGISLFMVALTAVLFPIGLLARPTSRGRRPSRSGCSSSSPRCSACS